MHEDSIYSLTPIKVKEKKISTIFDNFAGTLQLLALNSWLLNVQSFFWLVFFDIYLSIFTPI